MPLQMNRANAQGGSSMKREHRPGVYHANKE